MKNLIFCFTLSFLTSFISAQPDIEWQKALGGSKNDVPFAIQTTSDGGSIMAGISYSLDGDVSENQGDCDLWLVKLDEAGNIQWGKSHGGNYFDFAKSIQQTSDGGYIVTGFTNSEEGEISSNFGKTDCLVVKLTAEGDIQWQKYFGGSENDYGECVRQTMDGGYIIGVTTGSKNGDIVGNHGGYDLWLIKLSDTGGLQWQKALGGSNDDALSSVEQTTDGGFLIGGHTCSNDGDVFGFHGLSDIWVVKLSQEGDIEWQRALGGSTDSYPGATISTSDGGYIVAGGTKASDGDVSGNHGNQDAWVVKLNHEGNIVWQKALGGSGTDEANSIQQTSYGGFIVAGRTLSADGDVSGTQGGVDFWVLRLDDSGEIQWQKTLGGSKNESECTIRQTQDQGYILIGETDSNDGDISGNHGLKDFWVVKLSPESVDVKTPKTPELGFLEIFPNPANKKIFLKTASKEVSLDVLISDAQGRIISRQNIRNGADLDVSTLPNGLFTVVVTTSAGEVFFNKIRKQQ